MNELEDKAGFSPSFGHFWELTPSHSSFTDLDLMGQNPFLTKGSHLGNKSTSSEGKQVSNRKELEEMIH